MTSMKMGITCCAALLIFFVWGSTCLAAGLFDDAQLTFLNSDDPYEIRISNIPAGNDTIWADWVLSLTTGSWTFKTAGGGDPGGGPILNSGFFLGAETVFSVENGQYVMTMEGIDTDMPLWASWTLNMNTADWELKSAGEDTTPGLIFTPDAGIRKEDAVQPKIGYDGTTYYLFYESRAQSTNAQQMVVTSTDGLVFQNEAQADQYTLYHPGTLAFSDGTLRKYYNPSKDNPVIISDSSSDNGKTFTTGSTVHYQPQADDNNSIGVTDFYIHNSMVVMNYVGDLTGANNVRQAVSTDNGETFQFSDGDVFGDADAGGGGNTYIDPASILLPDGNRRMITMRSMNIFTFLSKDGLSYEREPGIRLKPGDFTEFEVTSLNDPVLVELPDGRFRMYVAAIIVEADNSQTQAIVSATSN